ncbi:MAG: CidA/LrgA family protein [Arenicellales bacterium]
MLGPIFLILFLQLVGEIIQRYFSLAIPGPVIGLIILLTVLLTTKKSPSPRLSDFRSHFVNFCNALLNHLSLLFVPIGVGVVMHLALLEAQLLGVLTVILLGTLSTMIFTAYVFLRFRRTARDD